MRRVIATSWDDGLESDKRLLGILEHHDVRSSFAVTPGRHLDHPVPNDRRNVQKYGMLMRKQDLKLYAEHDVCNHTLSHHEMLMGDDYWKQEIREGKARLEDMYGRPIPGMIWPYGVSNPITCVFAKNLGHEFGRTTQAAHRVWVEGYYCRWDIVPFHWKTPFEVILNSSHTHLALCGHTYELQSEDDWLYLDELYRILSSDPGCQLVTLDQLAKEIAKYESHSCL